MRLRRRLRGAVLLLLGLGGRGGRLVGWRLGGSEVVGRRVSEYHTAWEFIYFVALLAVLSPLWSAHFGVFFGFFFF
jgi:hypothetical protein